MTKNTNLLSVIEETREKMFETANSYGLNSIETIKISKYLDSLLNQLECQMNESGKK
jgi:hypothetical protein